MAPRGPKPAAPYRDQPLFPRVQDGYENDLKRRYRQMLAIMGRQLGERLTQFLTVPPAPTSNDRD